MSREDFVLYLCTLMVSLMTYGIIESFFPGEDFVLCIFSPLLLTFYCGNDYIFEDFVLGGFCPLPMHFNGLLDYLWHFRVFFSSGRILSRRRILSSSFILHYYLHSVVAMIAFWRILSREDFVLYLWNSMVSLISYGILEYFFPGRILSSAYFLPYYLHSVVVMIEF